LAVNDAGPGSLNSSVTPCQTEPTAPAEKSPNAATSDQM
jgi:hypothetical protein